uniref:hypothetical protein n=1 Tax=Escherichia coli TaxID=562 RepID=UPI001F264EDA|nr:hypothetical protein [Escherichia coli]UGK56736.1 hypothetical protein [Escherichia coli]
MISNTIGITSTNVFKTAVQIAEVDCFSFINISKKINMYLIIENKKISHCLINCVEDKNKYPKAIVDNANTTQLAMYQINVWNLSRQIISGSLPLETEPLPSLTNLSAFF